MNIKLQSIYLFSETPSRLYNFLSFILDVEASEYEDDKIVLPFGAICFEILKPIKKKVSKNLPFSLVVPDESCLLNLKSNIEFFYYKEQQSKYLCSVQSDKLLFSDPDGREWRVNVSNDAYKPIQVPDPVRQHVRNC